MFRLEKEIHFEAAHFLPHHDGVCRNLHGHGYRAVLVLESEELVTAGPKVGMVQDYADVSAAVRPLLEDYLDHKNLNETTGLENTTSEELARWLFQKLKPSLPLLAAVRIHETCTASTEYRP